MCHRFCHTWYIPGIIPVVCAIPGMCHQFCHTWYTWYYIKWSVPHLVCAVSVQTQRGFCAVLPILRKLLPWPHLLTMFWIDEFKLFKNFPTKPQISRYPVERMQFNKQIYLRDIWHSVQLSFLLESWPSTSPPWDDWRDWEQDLVSDCCWFCSTRKTFQGDKRKIAKQSPSLSPDLWYLSHWIKSSDWSTSLAPFYIWLLTTYYWPWTSNFSQLNFFVYGFSRPCNCDTVRRTHWGDHKALSWPPTTCAHTASSSREKSWKAWEEAQFNAGVLLFVSSQNPRSSHKRTKACANKDLLPVPVPS